MEPLIFTTAKEFFKYRDKIEESMILRRQSLFNKENQLVAVYQPQKNKPIDMKKQDPKQAQKIFEESLPEDVERFINVIKSVRGIDKIINSDDERSDD